jgi:hypothetical protein
MLPGLPDVANYIEAIGGVNIDRIDVNNYGKKPCVSPYGPTSFSPGVRFWGSLGTGRFYRKLVTTA